MPTLIRRPAEAGSVLAAVVVALFTLVACRSGNGDEAAPPRTTFVQATVASGSALQLAGTTFSTRGGVLRMLDDGTSATLETDGEARTLLHEGAVVSARGEIADGEGARRASELLYRSLLRGPLARRGESALAVGGADVDVGAATVVLDAGGAPTTLAGLPAGGRIEVSGWAQTGNRVRATLVRGLPGTPPVVVHGWTLAAPVDGAFVLSLLRGGSPLLRVDLSAASGGSDLPANALVRVRGTTIAAGSPPTLTAESVSVVSQVLPFREDRAVIEGVVTGGTAAAFELGEHPVATSPATAYDGVPEGGTAAAAHARGVRLVAEGTFDGERILAERIRFVELVRLAGRIAPTTFVIGNPSISAGWEMGATNVLADTATQLTGVGGATLTLGDLADLHTAEPAGLPIVVHGYLLGDGTLQAHRVDVTPG